MTPVLTSLNHSRIGKPILSQFKPWVFKMWFYGQNLPMGVTNCKCNALVLEIGPLVAKRICRKREESFLPLQQPRGFARKPQPGLQRGLSSRSRLSWLQGQTDLALANSLQNDIHLAVSVWFFCLWQKASSHNTNEAYNRYLENKDFWEKNGRKHCLGKSS